MKGILSSKNAILSLKGVKMTHKKTSDTGLLYSVNDIARFAHVSPVFVTQLCIADLMPPWQEVEGRRYWNGSDAVEAIVFLVRAKNYRVNKIEKRNAS